MNSEFDIAVVKEGSTEGTVFFEGLAYIRYLGLDAAMVLGSWALALALAFDMTQPGLHGLLAAGAAQLAYHGDHWLDGRRVGPQSLRRHQLASRSRLFWATIWSVSAALVLMLAVMVLPPSRFWPSSFLALFAVLYLGLGARAPQRVRIIFPREVIVGLFFTAGVVVLLGFGVLDELWRMLSLACLCVLNGLTVTFLEKHIDSQLGEITSIRRWPFLAKNLVPIAWGTGVVIGLGDAVVHGGPRAVSIALFVSAASLAEIVRRSFRGDGGAILSDLMVALPALVWISDEL